MPREIVRREELVAAYHRPYRRSLPVAWAATRTPATLAKGLAVAACGGGVAALTSQPRLIVLGGLALLVAAVVAVWTALLAARHIRRRTKAWSASSELGAVRSARPHALEYDPVIAHDEFMVTVEDPGGGDEIDRSRPAAPHGVAA